MSRKRLALVPASPRDLADAQAVIDTQELDGIVEVPPDAWVHDDLDGLWVQAWLHLPGQRAPVDPEPVADEPPSDPPTTIYVPRGVVQK